MSEFYDFAYYLDRRQLLLLLSLIDQRPVYGLPASGGGTAWEDWQAAALSLLVDRRVCYQNGQMAMDPRLGGLLLAMKDARYTLAAYGWEEREFFPILYVGENTTQADFFPDGGCRLRQGAAPTLQALAEGGIAPRYPAPDALEAGLSQNEPLLRRLSHWEAQTISIDDPPACWRALEFVRGVVERVDHSGERCRWIWVDDPSAGLVLCQKRGGTLARLDTQSCRQSLEREWRGEA